MLNLAILSPNENVYSETFIRAHKNLPFNNKFYFGGLIPTHLENDGYIQKNHLLEIFYRIKYKINKRLSPKELALIHSLKRNNIDVILAEFGVTAAESLNTIMYLKKPLIVHFHGADASEKSILKKYEIKYKEIFTYAHTVIVVSKAMEETLLNMGCPRHKVLLNTYGPSPAFFNVIPDYNSKQFISVGRFVDKKAPYATIKAFKSVIEQYPDAILLMIGDGPLLNTCKNLAKIWGIEKNIIFKGVQTPEEIRTLFCNSLAFVQHSIVAENGDSEGTPVGILEAQAAGLPVVSTKHAGIPDVVIHEKTGLLCEELDVNMMALNMLRLIKSPELCKVYGDYAKLNIKEYFSLEKHLGLLEKVILDAKA